jgi:hypothetical protein
LGGGGRTSLIRSLYFSHNVYLLIELILLSYFPKNVVASEEYWICVTAGDEVHEASPILDLTNLLFCKCTAKSIITDASRNIAPGLVKVCHPLVERFWQNPFIILQNKPRQAFRRGDENIGENRNGLRAAFLCLYWKEAVGNTGSGV